MSDMWMNQPSWPTKNTVQDWSKLLRFEQQNNGKYSSPLVRRESVLLTLGLQRKWCLSAKIFWNILYFEVQVNLCWLRLPLWCLWGFDWKTRAFRCINIINTLVIWNQLNLLWKRIFSDFTFFSCEEDFAVVVSLTIETFFHVQRCFSSFFAFMSQLLITSLNDMLAIDVCAIYVLASPPDKGVLLK